ncbi:MAG: tryptophanase [Candidatus Falkowbacteria bacterium]|nr:tryptophanase [Candidatus Falkowbacteria bacterium]
MKQNFLRRKAYEFNKLLKSDDFDLVQAVRLIAEMNKSLDETMGIIPLKPKDLVPPWIIKTVQHTSTSSREDRLRELARTGNNVFMVKAETILLDYLTDSGTGAQSDKQWAEIMAADERYSHSITYEKFVPVVQGLFAKNFILPVHQGRTAENIVFTTLLKNLVARASQKNKKIVCTGNSYFDTTLGNAFNNGAKVISADCPESKMTNEYHCFKGNADVARIKAIIEEYGPENIGFIVMTVVNNTIGGQPVSLANLRAVQAIAKEHNILFILDSARIFENAYFIQQRETGYQDLSIEDITKEMTALADIVLMSGKKDGIVNMGGLIATDDQKLYDMFKNYCILIEGHYSYGGMSGRDLAALALGLKEGSNQEHLRQRINQVTEFGNGFRRLGLPIQWPPGSNGIFLDAREFLPHINKNFFPAQRLCVEIYREYGIRPVEIGLSLVGRNEDGIKNIPAKDFVRFTVPRRVYTDAHLQFTIEALSDLHKNRDNIGGLIYKKEGLGNGHFTSTFDLVNVEDIPRLSPEVERYFSTPNKTYEGKYLPPNAEV